MSYCPDCEKRKNRTHGYFYSNLLGRRRRNSSSLSAPPTCSTSRGCLYAESASDVVSMVHLKVCMLHYLSMKLVMVGRRPPHIFVGGKRLGLESFEREGRTCSTSMQISMDRRITWESRADGISVECLNSGLIYGRTSQTAYSHVDCVSDRLCLLVLWKCQQIYLKVNNHEIRRLVLPLTLSLQRCLSRRPFTSQKPHQINIRIAQNSRVCKTWLGILRSITFDHLVAR